MQVHTITQFVDTYLWTLICGQPLMSIMDQIDPPWQTANISVLFNAFETCFPQCITDMSRVYFSSVNYKKIMQIY